MFRWYREAAKCYAYLSDVSIDSLDSPKSEEESGRLIDYLPRNRQGCIVFTTRDRKTAVKLAQQNIVEVLEMMEEVAMQLLETHLLNQNLINDKKDMKTILVQLTYLPLAIVQAAAYIDEHNITLADYLLLLKDQEEEVIELFSEDFEDDWRYQDIKNPVATTWLISFEQIRHRDPLAADFLSFMVCVDPKDIPQSLLPPGLSRNKEMVAIGTLDAYSFITRRSKDLAFDLHRLVYLVTWSWLQKEEVLVEWTKKEVSRVNDVFPDNDYWNVCIWRRYLAHARHALGSNLIEKSGENRVSLAGNFRSRLHFDGRFNKAEAPLTEVMETRKRILGVEHPDTLTMIDYLASTYRRQGRLKEAEELGVQVVEIGRKALGVEHLSTLSGISNLVSTYREQGRLKEAEELGVQLM
jgi:hypothetical protein